MSLHHEPSPAAKGSGWLASYRDSFLTELAEFGYAARTINNYRTSLPAGELDAVRAYKRLSAVERAFRSLKTVDLKVWPVFHRTADRVRAHVFLCMLAYYVEWHMRARLKPLLFDDHDPAAAEAARTSIVAPARVSDAAKEKVRGKRTANGLPVHSFRTLLGDLATIVKIHVVPRLPGAEPFEVLTRPTALQREAFKLLDVVP